MSQFEYLAQQRLGCKLAHGCVSPWWYLHFANHYKKSFIRGLNRGFKSKCHLLLMFWETWSDVSNWLSAFQWDLPEQQGIGNVPLCVLWPPALQVRERTGRSWRRADPSVPPAVSGGGLARTPTQVVFFVLLVWHGCYKESYLFVLIISNIQSSEQVFLTYMLPFCVPEK